MEKNDTVPLVLRKETLRQVSAGTNWVPAFLMEFDFEDSDQPMTIEEAAATVEFWTSRREYFLRAVESALGNVGDNFYLPGIGLIEVWPAEESGKKYLVISQDDLGACCKEYGAKIHEIASGEARPHDRGFSRSLSEARRAWRDCIMAAHPLVAARGLSYQDRVFSQSRSRMEEAYQECLRKIEELGKESA